MGNQREEKTRKRPKDSREPQEDSRNKAEREQRKKKHEEILKALEGVIEEAEKRKQRGHRSSSWVDQDPREMPNYGIAEAAHYLLIPPATLRSWVGRSFAKETREKAPEPPIIVPSNGGRRLALSFMNLVEAYVLEAVRRACKIPPPKVREALGQQRVSSKHPLACRNRMRVIPSLSFAEGNGQQHMLEAYLCRIDWDEEDLPARLHLLTEKPKRRLAFQIPKVVVIDPYVSFGRPVLVGTGIPTTAIAERFKSGEPIVALAEDYGRQPSEIEAAIRFELQLPIA